MINTGHNCPSCGIPVNTVVARTGEGLCHNCQPVQSEPELKSCPFCGGGAIHKTRPVVTAGLTSTPHYQVECTCCGAKSYLCQDLNEVLYKWNTRHNPASEKIKAEIERLEEIIGKYQPMVSSYGNIQSQLSINAKINRAKQDIETLKFALEAMEG